MGRLTFGNVTLRQVFQSLIHGLIIVTASKLRIAEGGICRDGGSLVADFYCEDGSILSFLLEVALGQPKYRHLHAGAEIQNSCEPASLVTKGSPRDIELTSMLRSWAADCEFRPSIEAHLERGTRPPLESKEYGSYWAFLLINNLQNREV